MKVFAELGREIGNAWRRADYDERAFPAIAAARLEASRLHERVGPEEILGWVGSSEELPQQATGDKFGEPPISMYHGRRFHIDVLFWLDGTTAIHEHAFSGAFGVLAGSSIESSYSFTLRRRVNSHFLIGELEQTGVEMLRAGDVREIVGGEEGAHSLFHLDRPSVSVVIRTFNDPESQPQYLYRRPSVAVDPFYFDPHVDRRVRSLKVLLETAHPALLDIATQMIDRHDLELAFRILELCYAHPTGHAHYAELARRAAGRHGETVISFEPVFEMTQREARIIDLRSRIHSAEHRFFLALLLNLEHADLIHAMIHERFPASEPEALIDQWFREMAVEAPLGIELDDFTMALYRSMRRGLDLPLVIDELVREAESGAFEVSVSRIASQYAALRRSALFAPLLPK